MWAVLTRVFRQGRYAVLALVLFFLGLSVVTVLPNLGLVWEVLGLDTVSIWSKLTFITSLYGSLLSNFTPLSAFYTTLLLILFSINTSLLLFYIRRVQNVTRGHKRVHAGSLLGMISGVFGIGCAACGSVIVTGLAASFGITGLLAVLPLHGGELAIAGIILFIWTSYYVTKKISDPLICDTN